MVFGYFIGDTYCKISVVHEYRDTFLRTLRKGDGAVSFSAIISYRASRFFSKKFSPQAMSYDKVCTVPKSQNLEIFYHSSSFQ